MSKLLATPPLAALSRSDFKAWVTVSTRWSDNDVYGHVNNATYFSYFDTAVNNWLIDNKLLHINSTDVAQPVGLVVDNHCQYFAEIHYPQMLELGLRIEHLGNSSVRYGLGIFVLGDNPTAPAKAQAQFTHVYVNRDTRKPMPLPAPWRALLESLT